MNEPIELVPGALIPVCDDSLRAVGVVETQQRSLRMDGRGAEAMGMVGVSLDLCGPAVVGFHQQTHGVARVLEDGPK